MNKIEYERLLRYDHAKRKAPRAIWQGRNSVKNAALGTGRWFKDSYILDMNGRRLYGKP